METDQPGKSEAKPAAKAAPKPKPKPKGPVYLVLTENQGLIVSGRLVKCSPEKSVELKAAKAAVSATDEQMRFKASAPFIG